MKRILSAIAIAACAVPAFAQQVGVSVQVNQPGLYGRIDIGSVPQPPVVIYQQPMVIQPSPVAVYQAPIYLRVPPGHERRWSYYCGRYGACGQPVYFVREDWYQRQYVPAHWHGHGHDHDRDHDDHGHDRGHDRDDHDREHGRGRHH
jgi:hypothetical protein